MRILVIDDEDKLASLLKRALKEQNYCVDLANNETDALHMAFNNPYDMIILDVMLDNHESGFTICKKIREQNLNIPILMLTAKTSIADKVKGLNLGADDYLTKPFAIEELFARTRVLLRRNSNNKQTTLIISDLEMNLLTHKVKRGSKEIELTSTEFALLEYLMRNANNVVTRTMISEHVWNDDFDSFSNIINVYIQYLRKKIDGGFEEKLIHSIRGTGYILKDNNL